MRILTLALVLFATTAFADPVRFSPGDTDFRIYLSGFTPSNTVGVKWCANYVGNPISPTCIDGQFEGAGTPVSPVYPAEVSVTGYQFDLCFKWQFSGGGESNCPDPGVYFPTMIETYRADSTFDGAVGAPDFNVLTSEMGCLPSGCPTP